jgi:radical SAM protein with 4Fe4S-binding SPASM domain
MMDNLLPILSWIKFSVDSGTGDTYSYLHGTNERDYKRVLDNISKSSFKKRLKKYKVKIGVQSILFESNIDNMLHLAKILKYLKPDYFVVKPYSEHNKSINNELKSPTKEQLNIFIKGMQLYKQDFEFIYRDIAFSNVKEEKSYNICYGKDFMAYIDTLGNVYSCINFIGNNDYIYGNIYRESFKNIWKNKKEINPNIKECRTICRLDNINNYLWELKNPSEDINFI